MAVRRGSAEAKASFKLMDHLILPMILPRLLSRYLHFFISHSIPLPSRGSKDISKLSPEDSYFQDPDRLCSSIGGGSINLAADNAAGTREGNDSETDGTVSKCREMAQMILTVSFHRCGKAENWCHQYCPPQVSNQNCPPQDCLACKQS